MDQPIRLRCARCWSVVAPSEGACAGCGTVFSPEEIEKAMQPQPAKERANG